MKHLLENVHIFSKLSDEELDLVIGICRPETKEAGAQIVLQNTTGKDMFIVDEGSIEVYVEVDGVDKTIVFLGHGQLFGEMTLLDQGHRSASGRAGKGGCSLVRMDNDDFKALCEDNPKIGYSVMKHFAMDMAFKLRHMNLTSA